MTRHIPNFLTICNLACGCYGTVAVFQGDLQTGAIMIWLGAGFDFLDGFAARLLKKFSIIGKDLDSLADLITFCFLPGAILFSMINAGNPGFLGFSGFLLVVFGALRLAKFNNDTRQADNLLRPSRACQRLVCQRISVFYRSGLWIWNIFNHAHSAGIYRDFSVAHDGIGHKTAFAEI
ncbi:MAG: CDP-alcohol phosphatidyltransferase family protein [Cyclobacteriaceae bacterium]|nr:CDP-alcohol phosphatidyltransferase family protein [Cyclobacteriaceae bacterium]